MINKNENLKLVCFLLIITTIVLNLLSIGDKIGNKGDFLNGVVFLFLVLVLANIDYIPNAHGNKAYLFFCFAAGLFYISLSIIRFF